jgi:hypothetical protein
MAKSLSNIIRAGGANTPLPVSFGGTGLATLTANNVVLGNGTNTPQLVAPGTSGNVLTSNGTTWSSTTPQVSLASLHSALLYF